MVGERDSREESFMEPREPSKFSFHDGRRESEGRERRARAPAPKKNVDAYTSNLSSSRD